MHPLISAYVNYMKRLSEQPRGPTWDLQSWERWREDCIVLEQHWRDMRKASCL